MMNAVCGSCKGHHETIAEYRECSGVGVKEFTPQAPTEAQVMDRLSGTTTTRNPPSDRQVQYALDLLENRVWPDGFSDEDLRGMERRTVSELIDSLHKAPRKDTSRQVGATGAKTSEFKDIPKGRYALSFEEKGNPELVWRFYQVKQGHTRTFVDMLIGAPGDYQRRPLGANGVKVLKRIQKDPRQASIDYGIHAMVCGVCSSPLSDPESIAYGIGPKCRKKTGW